MATESCHLDVSSNQQHAASDSIGAAGALGAAIAAVLRPPSHPHLFLQVIYVPLLATTD